MKNTFVMLIAVLCLALQGLGGVGMGVGGGQEVAAGEGCACCEACCAVEEPSCCRAEARVATRSCCCVTPARVPTQPAERTSASTVKGLRLTPSLVVAVVWGEGSRAGRVAPVVDGAGAGVIRTACGIPTTRILV